MELKSVFFTRVSIVILTILMLLPVIFMAQKIATEYAYLKDTKFQVEKLHHQFGVAQNKLNTAANHDALLRSDLNHLDGTDAQAAATLQTRIRAMISSVGGAVDTLEGVNSTEESTTHLFSPISINVRWNTSELGMGKFLAALSDLNQNIAVDSITVQRRHGTGSILDVRMTISSLWLRQNNAERKVQE